MITKFEFGWIGWCKDDNHDKIWGFFYRPGEVNDPYASRWEPKKRNVCIFWGRRGKALQFKAGISGYELNKLINSKENKGYTEIQAPHLETIWPTFESEAEMKLSLEVLAGRVK